MTNPPTTTEQMRAYYEKLYTESEHYWGQLPSPLALLLLSKHKPASVLELGCGQGADALYFASKGVHVTAIDIAPSAITALDKHAKQLQLHITTHCADMRASFVALDGQPFDALFSRMTLQTIAPPERRAFVADLKQAYLNALHAHVVPISGASFGDAFICDDNFLKDAYADWEILFYEEAWTIARRKSAGGEPYLMREARIIARRKAC